MRIKLYIPKIIAWFIILLWLTRSFLFRLFQIDFASHCIEESFRYIWLLLIPLAVIILVVKSWKEIKFTFKRTILLVILTTLTFGLILVLNFLSSICALDYSKPIYKHRAKNLEIKFRELNCGATDGNPTIELVVTRKIGRYLIKYSKISKNEINDKDWVKERTN